MQKERMERKRKEGPGRDAMDSSRIRPARARRRHNNQIIVVGCLFVGELFEGTRRHESERVRGKGLLLLLLFVVMWRCGLFGSFCFCFVFWCVLGSFLSFFSFFCVCSVWSSFLCGNERHWTPVKESQKGTTGGSPIRTAMLGALS